MFLFLFLFLFFGGGRGGGGGRLVMVVIFVPRSLVDVDGGFIFTQFQIFRTSLRYLTKKVPCCRDKIT